MTKKEKEIQDKFNTEIELIADQKKEKEQLA